MKEIWKFIDNNHKYMVSNLGKVKNAKTDYVLKARPNKTGYLRVPLFMEGKHKDLFVHKLVAIAFLKNDNREAKTQVNHINCNKLDNTVSNLEWCTPSYNTKHAFIMNRKSNKGENNPRVKLSYSQVLEIKNLLKSKSLKQGQIAKLYNVSRSTIQAINSNINWK